MLVQADRIADRVEILSHIGRTPGGGVTRVAWSEPYWRAEEVVRSWMEEAGLTVRRDSVGNLIGRRAGRVPWAPAIMLASHFDSVVEGGHFDGVAGILSAIEVAQVLAEEQVELRHPVEVVAFIEEEGSRFGSGLLGSRAMMGELGPEVHDWKDRAGASFRDVLQQSGLNPDRLRDAARPRDDIAAYIELHIEQGAVLESAEHPVGVVTGIVGLHFLRLTLDGRADHAGATPMALRADALAGAAELVLAAERSARDYGSAAVGTVGHLEVQPGQSNIIPGRVIMTFDLRDLDDEALAQRVAEIRREIERVGVRRGLRVKVEDLIRADPVVMAPEVVEAIVAGCERVNVPVHRLPSGAGHDAQVIGRHVPAGMIFVRCREGISHNPAEFASTADLAAGARVMYHSTLVLDARLSV